MNILQAYIKFFGKFFIHIIGLPGSNSYKFAKELASDLKIQVIDITQYMDSYKSEIKLPGFEKKIVNKYDISSIKFKKLIEDINIMLPKGVILSSYGLSLELLKIKPDLQIVLDINTKYAIQTVVNTTKSDLKLETSLFNNYLIPYYEEIKNNEKINKFINIKGKYDSEMDNLWDYVISFINRKVYSDEVKEIPANTLHIRVPTEKHIKNFSDYDVTKNRVQIPNKYTYKHPRSYKPKQPIPQNLSINKTITTKDSKISVSDSNNSLDIKITDTNSTDSKSNESISDLFVSDSKVSEKKNNKNNELSITVTHPNEKLHSKQLSTNTNTNSNSDNPKLSTQESDLIKAAKKQNYSNYTSESKKESTESIRTEQRKAEELRKKEEKERQKRERDKKRKAEELRKKKEREEQRKAEELRKKKEREEQRRTEELRKKKEKEEQRRAEELRKKKEREEQRKAEELRKKEEKERQKREKEELRKKKKKEKQEKRKRLLEEHKRKKEEVRKKILEEEKRNSEEKKKLREEVKRSSKENSSSNNSEESTSTSNKDKVSNVLSGWQMGGSRNRIGNRYSQILLSCQSGGELSDK